MYDDCGKGPGRLTRNALNSLLTSTMASSIEDSLDIFSRVDVNHRDFITIGICRMNFAHAFPMNNIIFLQMNSPIICARSQNMNLSSIQPTAITDQQKLLSNRKHCEVTTQSKRTPLWQLFEFKNSYWTGKTAHYYKFILWPSNHYLKLVNQWHDYCCQLLNRKKTIHSENAIQKKNESYKKRAFRKTLFTLAIRKCIVPISFLKI